jgi:aerobic carbon-monoxide dehydrogenase medium subunit
MKRCEYIPAKTLSEALDVLSEAGDRAKLIAGGTGLMSAIMAGRAETPEIFVSLHRVRDLDYVTLASGSLRIGALASLRRVELDDQVRASFPALAEAIAHIGSLQVRNVGTVVGNLCGASSSADAAVALLSIGAKVRIISKQGEKDVDLADFFTGPARTVLGRGELVKEVVLPVASNRTAGAFQRVSPRSALDGLMVAASTATTVTLGAGGEIEDLRIALGSLAQTPIRAREAEKLLKGQKPTADTLEAAGQAATRESQPVEDIRGSAEYRKALARVLVKRTVEEAVRRAQSSARRESVA